MLSQTPPLAGLPNTLGRNMNEHSPVAIRYPAPDSDRLGGAPGCAPQSSVHQRWKTVELFIPSDKTEDEVQRYLRNQIKVIAYQGGDFVEQFRVDAAINQSGGWHKWSVSYLPNEKFSRLLLAD